MQKSALKRCKKLHQKDAIVCFPKPTKFEFLEMLTFIIFKKLSLKDAKICVKRDANICISKLTKFGFLKTQTFVIQKKQKLKSEAKISHLCFTEHLISASLTSPAN
jgi:hypothetical protein